jgi:hypothetical protein
LLQHSTLYCQLTLLAPTLTIKGWVLEQVK